MQIRQIEVLDRSPPGLDFLLRLEAIFAVPQDLGETPAGNRRILVLEKGQFAGPQFRGVIREGGGDWVLIRRDGIAELDIRLTLETEGNALIFARGNGIFDMDSETRLGISQGGMIGRDRYYFRTAFTFETAAEPHLRLNRLIAIGVGERTAVGMITDVFAVK